MTISSRIKATLDLLKQDDGITGLVGNAIYSDGVLEEFEVPSIIVGYREVNEVIGFPDSVGRRRYIDRIIHTIKIYSNKSSEVIELAQKVKDLLISNNYKYVDGERLKDEKYFVFILEFRKIEV